MSADPEISGVLVQIVRYLDDSQPGWVEFRLIDARGREWSFVEKDAIICSVPLDARSVYPCVVVLACRRIEREGTPEVVTIDTEWPWNVAATTGETRFEVHANQLIEVG